jgi:zinc protease
LWNNGSQDRFSGALKPGLRMVEFKRFSLDNGLKLIVNEDRSTPMVALNILYKVGSRDEDPENTGLAHLFEHLMFSGSVNIPDFDTPLQLAGGENNAYTTNDITVYYLTLPKENIETGFWLESDRMTGLDFSKKNLGIQKKVVAEEFKQRYLNQPYGDAMHMIRETAYLVHPYRWPTIGKDLSHIEKANLETIRDFFYTHYAPNNAILTISGNIKPGEALRLTEKWFGGIEHRQLIPKNIPQEPPQKKERIISVEKKVPADVIYKVWHVCPRNHSDFRVLDLLTDVLAGGESGRLYNNLVRDKKLFSDVNTYITGDLDPGFLLFYGKVMNGVDIHMAEDELVKILRSFSLEPVPDVEMEKVKNKFEATTVLSNSGIMNKATNLSLYELLGDAGMINEEVNNYRSVTAESVITAAKLYLDPSNCTTLYYKSIKKKSHEK